MKYIILILMSFVLSNKIKSQAITNKDSSSIDFKFYQGRLSEKLLDSGTYIYFTSKYCNFIEFTSLSWGGIIVKYRLEKISNNSYSITSTVNRDSMQIRYAAIDSSMYSKIRKKKRYYKYLSKEKICRELTYTEYITLSIFSKFISEHNLKSEYLNFDPKLFVAWLKR